MSNDKNFVVRGPIGVGGSIKENVGTVTLSGSSGYGVVNGVYDNVSFSFAGQDATPTAIAFKDDGTKFYMVGTTTDTVYQYAAITPWEISPAAYENKSLSLSAQGISAPTGLFFKPDGTKLYVLFRDALFQYGMTTPWDISTASYDNITQGSFGSSSTQSFKFKPDGTEIYVADRSGDLIRQFTLSTPWDITTATATATFVTTGEETDPYGVEFNADGTRMYVIGSISDTIFEYILETAWSLPSARSSGISFNVATQVATAQSLVFGNSGKKLYILDSTTDTAYQYSTEIDVFSLDLSTGNYFNLSLANGPAQISVINPQQTQMFTVQISNINALTTYLEYPTSFKWKLGFVPSLSGRQNTLLTGFTIDGGTNYYTFISK